MVAWVAVAFASSPSCWQGIGAVSAGDYVRFDWEYAGDGPIRYTVSPDLLLECRLRADAPLGAWLGIDVHPWLQIHSLEGKIGPSWVMAHLGPSIAAGRWDVSAHGVVGVPFAGVGLGVRYRPSQRVEAVQLRAAITFPGPAVQAALLYTFGPRKPKPTADQED